ncbi:MAG TPA: pseudouridine-5'-phosphate glycosidase [Blastocatellia bacterium]|nr:pseudouridine-5'-phosphate glycosidase [Blastocatellia bacterium]
MTAQSEIRIADSMRRAMDKAQAIVALESTVIAHGLPQPLNLETARACEEAVRRLGAVPATIGIVDGAAVIGLNEDELKIFATGRASDGSAIEKVGLNNLAAVTARHASGATTVAATLKLASLAGLKVFSTGGIGGVHRGAFDSFDVSADLTALAATQMICVCAGAKAILDLPKTLEYLETLGVPVIGYRTEEFPAFYSRTCGLRVDATVQSADEAAEIAMCHWRMGGQTSVLVCVPVPEEFEIPIDEVERAVDESLRQATRLGIRGKALTPFLLTQLKELSGGRTLETNRALLINNAEVAAQISVSLAQKIFGPPKT